MASRLAGSTSSSVESDRAQEMEVHGCLALGGEDLRRRTYPGGPTLVRGAHTLLGPTGEPVRLARQVVAICRCGKSRIAPLCDGTHRFVPGFSDAPVAPVADPAPDDDPSTG